MNQKAICKAWLWLLNLYIIYTSTLQSSQVSSEKGKKRWRKKNQITWPSIIINSWWNSHASAELSLSLSTCIWYHESIVDCRFMQISLTSLFFFSSPSFLLISPLFLTNIPEKLNVVQVIYVIGQSIDIYFLYSLFVCCFFVCHLSSSFCIFFFLFCTPRGESWEPWVSIFIHYENQVIKIQRHDRDLPILCT